MKITKDILRKLIKEEVKSLLTEATRSQIGIELPNGKVVAVYCHWDGYPEHVGKILKKHYKNAQKIKDLLKVGKYGISALRKDVWKKHDFDAPYDEIEKKGWTTFYGRDRNDKGNMSHQYKNREEYGPTNTNFKERIKSKVEFDYTNNNDRRDIL